MNSSEKEQLNPNFNSSKSGDQKHEAKDWGEMLTAARSIDTLYQNLDQRRLGRTWSLPEFLAACSTDWGELVEQIMVIEGVRHGIPNKQAAKHELGDMLWALIVISDRLDIDLKAALLDTMEELEDRFETSQKDNPS